MQLIQLIQKFIGAKVLILGHAGHGKTTLAEHWSINADALTCSSSAFACLRVMWPLLRGQYAEPRECYADRINHRGLWFREIRKYNTPDPTRLARELLDEYDIYDGMRSDQEFWQCMEADLFDVVVWVGRAGVKPESSKSMKLTTDFVNQKCRQTGTPFYIIDNSGDDIGSAIAMEACNDYS